ncbi:MAG: acyl--CoA ligase [Acidimicrobiia bacterium]|nr:acyl--CoA ligase [Acidimicrobiia bacterium]
MTDGLTVGAVVANAATGAPDAVAAVVDGRTHSFAQLDQAATMCAQRLVGADLQRGDVVLVLAGTSFDLLAQFVGCARAGVVFAPLNPALDAGTIASVAERVAASACIVDEVNRPLARALTVPTLAVEEAAEQGTHTRLPAVTADDGHVAFFTSGSTGLPKAALLSHRTSVLRSHPGSQLEPRGPALCPYPLFHMGGWTIALQQWHARAGVVFVDQTDPQSLAHALGTQRIERFNAIPALWTRLADQLGERADGAFPDLRFADTGTSPTSLSLLETIARMAPNAHVRVFYGSTEAGNVASLHHEDVARKPGSCGRPSPLTAVRLAPDQELCVQGPLLFDGYLGDAEATQQVLVEGWYHTGDQATIDPEGFITITGRLGTVIRTGGEAVTPEVVETALAAHPAITDVAVFGVDDQQWGEIVWAAVVCGQPLDLDDVRHHLARGGPRPLAAHQRPRGLLVLDALPRTPATGQVDRHRLRRLAAELGQRETDP